MPLGRDIGVSLLTLVGLSPVALGIGGCASGVLLVWCALFGPAQNPVFGPLAYEADIRTDRVRLVLWLAKGYDQGPWRAEGRGTDHVKEIVRLAAKKENEVLPDHAIVEWLAELEQRQGAEARAWRLKQVFLLGTPLLVSAIGACLLGLWMMRRARAIRMDR